MLAVPDDPNNRAMIADWLELMAVASSDRRVSFEALVSAIARGEEAQEEDIAEEDAAEDRLILDAQEEVSRRQGTVGDAYPFRIDEKGRNLVFERPRSGAGAVYLFCLFLSHAFERSIIIRKRDAPSVTNSVRDLFQACATVAAGGFVRGPAYSFGSPRPDHSSFLKALKQVYRSFGDGTPNSVPRPAAPRNVKDDGVDVIAWRRSPDGLPGTQYLVAQVASGADWVNKSVAADRKHFHKYWFERTPGSVPTDAMFTPFELEPEAPNSNASYRELLVDHMQDKCYRFGHLFYRDRIAFHFAEGSRLIEEGETQIEGYKKLPKIVKWVDNYSKRLRKA
jgi:hypothetical protein